MVSANMASVSAMSVMKAKAVKKKVYARKTALNMVFAGKANANADGTTTTDKRADFTRRK